MEGPPPDAVLAGYDSYERARAEFAFDVPDRYNVAADLAGSPGADQLALVYDDGDGVAEYTFGDVDRHSDRLANLLSAVGVERGDRVAVRLPERPETAFVHLAVFKLGAVLAPMATVYDADALAYRLRDCRPTCLVTDADGLDEVEALDAGSSIETVVTLDPDPRSDASVRGDAPAHDDSFETVATRPDDDAILLYTSGTTGDPKGVVHGHRVLLGLYPGFEVWNDLRVSGDRLFWSNLEWAWTGSLLTHLYCAWHYRQPYLSRRLDDQMDPEAILETLERHGVTNAFLRPAELGAMRDLGSRVEEYDLSRLELVSSGGDTSGTNLFAWVEDALDVTVADGYGQTEGTLYLQNCPSWFDAPPEGIGRPVPGSDVELLDFDGDPVADGEIGEIALRLPHPVAFKRYLDRPDATAATLHGGWLLTGDMAVRDDAGNYRYVARKSDVIEVDGRLVNPREVERRLAAHPAVEEAVAVAGDDGVEAYVTLNGASPSDDLADEVRARAADLDAVERPERVSFVAEIPRTKRGKVKRAALRE